MSGKSQDPLSLCFLIHCENLKTCLIKWLWGCKSQYRNGISNNVCVLSCQVVFDSCDLMDCSLLGFSVRGILQARMLDWVVISSSRGFCWPGDQTRVSCISRQILHLLSDWRRPFPTMLLHKYRHVDWVRCWHMATVRDAHRPCLGSCIRRWKSKGATGFKAMGK